MITLLIVDDEKVTRDSIKDFIPWAGLGVDRVKTASNGLAALELAAQGKPDIVLTDVRMPKMDGIELSRKLRETYPDCKIIFISGYSDKEYLKSAINLKAVSYIEKPLNMEEIKSVVRETVRLCLGEEKKRNDDIEIRNRLNENLPLIHQKIAFELIKDHADLRELKAKYNVPLLELPESSRYEVLCVAFNWAFGLGACAKSEAKARVLNALNEADAGLPLPYAAGFIEDERLAYIAPAGPSGRAAAGRLLEAVNGLSRGEYTACGGLGLNGCLAQEIPDSYRRAAQSVEMQFYDGSSGVYDIRSFSEAKYAPDKGLARSFREAMRCGQSAAASQLIAKLTESVRALRSSDIGNIKNIYFHLLLAVFESAREKNLIEVAEKDEQSYIWQETDRIRFLTELSDYLLSNVRAVLSQQGQEGSENNKKIYEINKYIRDNISDKNLCVQAVAHNVFLNHQYLCSFYRKATGKTINDYITEIRMEKAKELLLDGRLKIFDVTARIGLGDPNYFSTLFKKYTGYTPSEYRERN